MKAGQSCCTPTRVAGRSDDDHAEHHDPAELSGTTHPTGHRIVQSSIPEQTFRMGDAQNDGRRGDGESPVHPVTVRGFEIDTTSVTNDDFARFVAATGYRTEAETFGYSAVFHAALEADDDIVGQPPETPWWFGIRGADWRHPGGPLSSLEDRADHPVVHVSWNDAGAYCAWAERALPTEAQWEVASRGGLESARYPWGDDLGAVDGQTDGWRTNIFQGTFPTTNTLDDGFLTTAPVRTFAPNAYGLWQTVGNVWEWCRDVFDQDTYGRDAQHGTVVEPGGRWP